MDYDQEPVDLDGSIAQVRRTFAQEVENRKEKLLFHMNNYSSVLDNLIKLQVLKDEELCELNLISEIERKKEALLDIIVKKDFLDANLILESLRDGESPSLQWLMRIIIKTVLSNHPDFDARLIKKPPPDWSHSSTSPSKPRTKLQSFTTKFKRLSGIVSPKTSSPLAVNLRSGEQSREPNPSRLLILEEKGPLPVVISTGAVMEESDYEVLPPTLPPKPIPTLRPRPQDYKPAQGSVDEHGYENPFLAHQGVNNGEMSLFSPPTPDISQTDQYNAGYQIPNLPRPAQLSDLSTEGQQPATSYSYGNRKDSGKGQGSRIQNGNKPGKITRRSRRKSFCCW